MLCLWCSRIIPVTEIHTAISRDLIFRDLILESRSFLQTRLKEVLFSVEIWSAQ
jgi:hypothetical protein